MALEFNIVPEFEYIVEDHYRTQQTPFEFGHVQTRAYWPRPKRIFRLHWDSATNAEKGYASSFFRDHVGPAGLFLYQPADPIDPPYRSGDPTASSGGAFGDRTYYFVLTWSTILGETTPSPESSFLVTANKLLTITVPKFWFKSITSANIYVGAAPGVYQLQANVTSTGGSWTELNTGLSSGSAPPSTNTANEKVNVHLMEDTFQTVKRTAISYNMDVAFEELF